MNEQRRRVAPGAPGRLTRVTAAEQSQMLRQSLAAGLLGADDPAAIFIAFDVLDDRLDHLRRTFPANALHAVAIKSNPLQPVLRHVVARGFGLEAASFEELMLARASGAPAERTVFDSPAKRQVEIDWCEQHLPGLLVNANALEELPRYSRSSRLRLGLRINPLAQAGSPSLYDVSREGSKFGVPIRRRAEILRAFVEVPALVGLHVHVGSGISDAAAAAHAVAEVYRLARDIDAACLRRGVDKRVEFVDVGGGAAAVYSGATQPGLGGYVRELRRLVPDIEQRGMVTEYGRFTQAHCGWAVSDVEYVLPQRRHDVAVLHIGADMFVREVYSGAPRHEVRAFDASGRPRRGSRRGYRLAGPLCFAGDFLGGVEELPRLGAGDRVVVCDVGANTFALWSRHCSRAFPKVLGYSVRRAELGILRPRELPSEALSIWRPGELPARARRRSVAARAQRVDSRRGEAQG